MVRLCSRNLEMLKRVSGRWELNGSSYSKKSKQGLNSSNEPLLGQAEKQMPIILRYFSNEQICLMSTYCVQGIL